MDSWTLLWRLSSNMAWNLKRIRGMGGDRWRVRVRQAGGAGTPGVVSRAKARHSRERCLAISPTPSDTGRRRAVMELSVILALAEFSENRRESCVDALRTALEIAVEEGFRRVFVREGRADGAACWKS